MFLYLKSRLEARQIAREARERENAFYAQSCGMKSGYLYSINDGERDRFYTVIDTQAELDKKTNVSLIKLVEWRNWKGNWMPDMNETYGPVVYTNAGDLNSKYRFVIQKIKSPVTLEVVFPDGNVAKRDYHPGEGQALFYDISAFYIALFENTKASIALQGISPEGGIMIAATKNLQFNFKLDDTVLEMEY